MSQPQTPTSPSPAPRKPDTKPYRLAGALGAAAGLMSLALAALRRR